MSPLDALIQESLDFPAPWPPPGRRVPRPPGRPREGAEKAGAGVLKKILTESGRDFRPKVLEKLLGWKDGYDRIEDRGLEQGPLALSFLVRGGKRFRPFLTRAAWWVLSGGGQAPLPVRRVALAMECFHKASLIHDDLVDGDPFRYGAPTVHTSHSPSLALNLGDFLLGQAYRLVAGEQGPLGGDRCARILGALASAQVRMAEGQGAELLWRQRPDKAIGPSDSLRIYALKTAPPFDAALYAGFVLAGRENLYDERVASFGARLGMAYQILNDLQDLQADPSHKVLSDGDLRNGSPTLLFALLWESAAPGERETLWEAYAGEGRKGPNPRHELRRLLKDRQIPLRAWRIVEGQRRRAMEAAEGVGDEGLRALLAFVTQTFLPEGRAVRL
jgi:geranylgeranyl pyrophosphate synthase